MFISCPCLLTYQFPCDLFVFYRFGDPRVLHSFPTRRSSDLNASQLSDGASACVVMDAKLAERRGLHPLGIFRGFTVAACEDRKSTRLNSSHTVISYAVFCLKKKKNKKKEQHSCCTVFHMCDT